MVQSVRLLLSVQLARWFPPILLRQLAQSVLSGLSHLRDLQVPDLQGYPVRRRRRADLAYRVVRPVRSVQSVPSVQPALSRPNPPAPSVQSDLWLPSSRWDLLVLSVPWRRQAQSDRWVRSVLSLQTPLVRSAPSLPQILSVRLAPPVLSVPWRLSLQAPLVPSLLRFPLLPRPPSVLSHRRGPSRPASQRVPSVRSGPSVRSNLLTPQAPSRRQVRLDQSVRLVPPVQSVPWRPSPQVPWVPLPLPILLLPRPPSVRSRRQGLSLLGFRLVLSAPSVQSILSCP